MTNTKTPEERAEEYEKLVHMADFKELNPSQLEAYLALDRKHAFFAGRADFIQNDLPKLLEMAREACGFNSILFSQREKELIQKAKEGV